MPFLSVISLRIILLAVNDSIFLMVSEIHGFKVVEFGGISYNAIVTIVNYASPLSQETSGTFN